MKRCNFLQVMCFIRYRYHIMKWFYHN